MKTLFAAVVTGVLSASVSADDIYHGWADGNSDLYDQHRPAQSVAAVQPSVGDGFDRYQGWADGNPDLFKNDHGDAWTRSQDPRIYQGFTGNPDITY